MCKDIRIYVITQILNHLIIELPYAVTFTILGQMVKIILNLKKK